MNSIVEQINDKTGLNLEAHGDLVFRNGLVVQRASVSMGQHNLSILIIDDGHYTKLSDIKDAVELSKVERVILFISNILTQAQMTELRAIGLGYVDGCSNYYVPLDLCSSLQRRLNRKEQGIKRASSMLNEFAIGYLFLKDYGLLTHSQVKIAKLIGKSTTTVSFVLKNMEKDKYIVKTSEGYHLTNIEEYFERWRFIFSEFKKKYLTHTYTSKLSREDVYNPLNYGNWVFLGISMSGPLAESLIAGGQLESATELSIFINTSDFNINNVVKTLKLVPDEDGDVRIYECSISLNNMGIFAHDVVRSAELISSSNPRVVEVGKAKLEEYLWVAKKEINARFDGKSF